MRRRVLVLCFLKMPVNLARYRMTGGNFNYRQMIVSLHYEAPLYSGMSNSFSKQGSSNSLLIFYFFFYILFLSKGNFLKIITKFSVPFFLFHKIFNARTSMPLQPFINVKWLHGKQFRAFK